MVKEYLKELGYKEKEIEDILKDERLQCFKKETLLNNIKIIYQFLLELQYTHGNIIKMTKTFPSLYSLNIENIRQKIEDLIALGYSREEVIKMTKKFLTYIVII